MEAKKISRDTLRKMAIKVEKQNNCSKVVATMSFFRDLGFAEDIVGQVVQADLTDVEDRILKLGNVELKDDDNS